MKKRGFHKPVDKQEIKQLHQAGLRPFQIAAQMDIARSTVTNVLKETGNGFFDVEQYTKELATI